MIEKNGKKIYVIYAGSLLVWRYHRTKYYLSKDKPNFNSLERAIRRQLYKLVSKYAKKTKHRIKNSIDLSGGQRQRIGIARSLYINRNIIFLDETTNALDEKTEAEILSSLKNEFKNKTVFIISHSKDLRKYVDRIIKIKKLQLQIQMQDKDIKIKPVPQNFLCMKLYDDLYEMKNNYNIFSISEFACGASKLLGSINPIFYRSLRKIWLKSRKYQKKIMIL